jgi:hypothetical protein
MPFQFAMGESAGKYRPTGHNTGVVVAGECNVQLHNVFIYRGRPLNYKFLSYLICGTVILCHVLPVLMLLELFTILL